MQNNLFLKLNILKVDQNEESKEEDKDNLKEILCSLSQSKNSVIKNKIEESFNKNNTVCFELLISNPNEIFSLKFQNTKTNMFIGSIVFNSEIFFNTSLENFDQWSFFIF